MRYELVADNPDEESLLSTQPILRTLFDPLLPLLHSRAIMAGVRLGVFAEVGSATRSVADLSTALGLDRDALHLLLRVLTGAGYLREEDGGYRLSPRASASLQADSPAPLSAWVEHGYFHWQVIDHLEQTVRTGEGVDGHGLLSCDVDWSVYQRAMLETARPAAAWVASHVPVPDGARRLLDLGGGHGLYGAAICRRHPPLRSEVIDLAEAIADARELARQEGIGDLVSHRAGDLRTEAGPADSCDVAFLGNITHHLTAEENRDLLRRLGIALRWGGTVAIWDFKRPPAGAKPDLVADGLALLFRLTSTTRCYTLDEYLSWLRAAGFADIEEHPTPSPSQLLVTARRRQPKA